MWNSQKNVICTEKHVLVKKMCTNVLNMGLPLQTWVEKTVHGVEAHWPSCKEKVLGAAVSKKCLAGTWKDLSLLISLKKGATINSISYCQLWQNSPYLLNDLHIHLTPSAMGRMWPIFKLSATGVNSVFLLLNWLPYQG